MENANEFKNDNQSNMFQRWKMLMNSNLTSSLSVTFLHFSWLTLKWTTVWILYRKETAASSNGDICLSAGTLSLFQHKHNHEEKKQFLFPSCSFNMAPFSDIISHCRSQPQNWWGCSSCFEILSYFWYLQYLDKQLDLNHFSLPVDWRNMRLSPSKSHSLGYFQHGTNRHHPSSLGKSVFSGLPWYQ